MKCNTTLVNMGRGDTVDTVALLKAHTASTTGEIAVAAGFLQIGGASLE